jgi:hypothetical protein
MAELIHDQRFRHYLNRKDGHSQQHRQHPNVEIEESAELYEIATPSLRTPEFTAPQPSTDHGDAEAASTRRGTSNSLTST